MTVSTDDLLASSPYAGYAYGYPHKTAYRPFDRPRALRELWRDEWRDALFLYVHIPFCEMRCGFCNLFTAVNAGPSLPQRYLDALSSEADQVAEALGDWGVARLAVGGGTPTYLDVGQLERLYDIAGRFTGGNRVPSCIEASPATLDHDKAVLLRGRGVDRLSLGVQTFDEAESKRLGRTQWRSDVERALGSARDAGFPTLNIDLIYGGDGQTAASWRASLRTALQYQPEEIYLYPLYIRPQTGLGRHGRCFDDHRLHLYRLGRDLLREAGYRQISMRMFQAPHAPAIDGPVYCCQQDGMVGLGCGARSYTRTVHYSSEYAVRQPGVTKIVEAYVGRETSSFANATYGFELDDEDRRRRHLIMSLLQCDGLDLAQYRARFAADVLQDVPKIVELEELDLATVSATRVRLTETGVERSDAIGPWLYSHRVRDLMETYTWR